MSKEHILGAKIQSLRESKNISREELAQRSGLTTQQIEHIEENTNIPSLSPLIKIARVLGVRLGTFLDDSDKIGPVVSRKGESTSTISTSNSSAGSHLDFYSLAAEKAGRHMEPFIIHIQSSKTKDFVMSSHEGEEFIYVLEGVIQISYGKDTFVLEEGDSIYYDSIVDHLVQAGGEQDAKILAVVYAPF
ncbi:MAG: XRE family transcriptional regulator [Prevotellaceae bacterium]|jgi:transcriptional regulator with XRE-family HTH domain|nr:XRE family transcriptional regulator [Prevotellaceae bacterium]